MNGQQYPLHWAKYATDNYFYDIEQGRYDNDVDMTKVMNDLVDLARANLAKQISVKVEEVSCLNKHSIDGITTITYNSERWLKTGIELKHAHTESVANDGYGFSIAYINKDYARNYYSNELMILLRNTDNALAISENYIKEGFKQKAKTELQGVLANLSQSDELLFWLNVFELPDSQLRQCLDLVHQSEQALKMKLSELEHGTTICVMCAADLFGQPYLKLQNEIMGNLSTLGCNFINDADKADYVIRVTANARKYNQFSTERSSAYFTYVDAVVIVDRCATGQRIFEDEISVKGSHTKSFEEAARNGYTGIGKKISNLITKDLDL